MLADTEIDKLEWMLRINIPVVSINGIENQQRNLPTKKYTKFGTYIASAVLEPWKALAKIAPI